MSDRIMKKIVSIALAAGLLVLSGCADKQIQETASPSKEDSYGDIYFAPVEVPVSFISEEGDICLDITPQLLGAAGYEAGDVISIVISDQAVEIPIGIDVDEVTVNDPICLFISEESGPDSVMLIVNDGSFLSLIESVNEEGPSKVRFEMVRKQGHADDYPADEQVYVRSGLRQDYPALDDEGFANFRMVDTCGMGQGILYRSSSPINSKLERNSYADEAVRKAGIKTIINMADHQSFMSMHEGYAQSCYRTCDVIALNMTTNFNAPSFEEDLCKGLRFLISHEGPYLIHCTEGKDRTGFLSAVLECLMGASGSEVVADYMMTYCNYYGIKLGSIVYDRVAQRNIRKDLEKAFGSDPLDESADLAGGASSYLKRIGLSEDEIDSLKTILASDGSGIE